jgi:hypothetical protein
MFNDININKSIIYFLLACIPIRIAFVLILKYVNKDYLPYLSIPLLLISFGFLFLYFKNIRLNAPEGGGVTWWANLRLIHGALYLTASIYAFQKKDITWIPLLIDVIFGLVSFLIHRKIIFKN